MAFRANGETVPATHRLGTHPRHADHPAMLDGAGEVIATFRSGALRREIAGTLARSGYVLNADNTITGKAAAPVNDKPHPASPTPALAPGACLKPAQSF